MANEADIPESISITKREREDKDLLGEPLNVEFQELPPCEVKKLESSSNQPLETAMYVGETISTQAASDIEVEKENVITKGDARTTEGEIFFESPSVPKVATNEASSISKDYEATKIQHQAEREISEIEAIEEGKLKEEHAEIVASKEASSDKHSSSTEENTKESSKNERGGLIEHKDLETTSGQNERCKVRSFDLNKVSDMVTDKVSEVCNKEDSTGDSSASSKENLQGASYHSGEGKESEISSTLVGTEMDVEALKPIEEIEKVEVKQQEVQHDGTTDVCTSTQKESPNNQNEEEAIGSGDDTNQKIGSPKISALVEETDSGKAGPDEDGKLADSSSIELSEKKAETLIEDEVQQNEQVPSFFPEKEQEKKNVEGSFAAAFKEMEETASTQPTETVPNFEEQRLFGSVEEILKEIKEKIIHDHEVSENRSPEAKVQNLPTSDLNEKGESAYVEIPIKSANESYLIHQQDDASDSELQENTTKVDNKENTIDEDEAVKRSSEICTDEEVDQGNKNMQHSSMEASSELDDRDKNSITYNETESITNQVIDEEVNEGPHENENTKKQIIHKEYTGQSPEFTGEETVVYCQEDVIEAEKGEEPETSSGSQDVKQQAEVEENRISDQVLASTRDDIIPESSKEDAIVIKKPKQYVHEVFQSADGTMDIEVKEVREKHEIDGANKETGEQKPEGSFNKPELPSSATGEENVEGNSQEDETDVEKEREEVKKLENEFIEQDFEATCHIKDKEARDMDDELNRNMDYNIQGNRGSPEGSQTKDTKEDIGLSSSAPQVPQNEIEDEVLEKAEPTFMGVIEETSFKGVKEGDKKKKESSDLSSAETGQVNAIPCETGSADVYIIATLAESSNLVENKSIQISKIMQNEADEAGGNAVCEASGGTSNILPDNKDEREISTGEGPLPDISEHIVEEISAPLSRQDNLVTTELIEATDRAPDNSKVSYVNADFPIAAETEDELQLKEDESMDPRDGAQMHSIDKQKDNANEEVPDEKEHLFVATALSTETSVSASDCVPSESIQTGEVANCSEIGEPEREKFEDEKPANNASMYVEADTTCRDAKSTPLEQNSTRNFRSSLEEDVEIGKVVLEVDAGGYNQKFEDPETKSVSTITEENLESVAPYEQLGSAPTSMAEEKSNETFPETSKAKTEEGCDNVKNQNLKATGEKTILFPDRGTAEMITGQDSQEDQSEMNEEVDSTVEAKHQLNETLDRIEKIKNVILTEEVPTGVEQPEESENIKEQIVRADDCITELQMISATDQQHKVVGYDVLAEENLKATGTSEYAETVQVQVAEDPNWVPEASSTTRAPQEEMMEGTENPINITSSAFKHTEETIGEEKIEEEEDIYRDTIETAPTTVMTVETSSEEVQLDDKSARDFDTSSEDKISVEPTHTKLQGEAVNIVKLEESSTIISQTTTAEHADVDEETVVVKMPDRKENEIKELEVSNAVSDSKERNIYICESGKSSTVHGTDTENYEEERNEVLETISEPKYQGVEEVVEGDNVQKDENPVTEKIEDESRKKDENPVTENLEGTDATRTKEETCSLEGGQRELEISTLELELVESRQKDSLDEAPEEASIGILETMAVVPEGSLKEKLNEGNETMDNDISSEQDLGRPSETENIRGEASAVEDPYQDLNADRTINVSCPQEKEEEMNVQETHTRSNETKSGETITEAKALTEENLQPHEEEELRSASESMAEDQINETLPEPKKAEIMDDSNNLTDQILECPVEQISGIDSKHGQRDLNEEGTLGNQINSTQYQIEILKDIILTEEIEQVPMEIQKTKRSEDIKDQIVEDTRELQTKTSSNEIVNEITYSDPTPIENPGATYLNMDTKAENLHAAEDLDGESEVSSIIKASEQEVKEGTENPLNISSSVLKVSEEEIREENINESGIYYDKEDTPPVPLLTETSAEKVQLDEKFTSQQDEVERVKLNETSSMVLPVITTELAVVEKEKVIAEKLDTDEVEAGEIKTSDLVTKSIEQDAEDVREIKESLIANRTDTDTAKEEVIEVLKSIPEPINQLEAITEGDKFPDKTIPSGTMTEQHEEPSSTKLPEEQKCGSTTTNENIDDESTKKDETLVKESLEGSFATNTKENACLPKEIPREVEVSKLELQIIGERINDSPYETTQEERISALEEAMALEPQEKASITESTDSPSDDVNSIEISTAMPNSGQESLKGDSADSLDSNKEIEGLLIVHSAVNKILPEELRDKEDQIKKANIANETTKEVSSKKMAEEKEAHKDFMVTDSICIEEMSEELERVDAKEKTEAVVTGELKTVTGSYQDDVAEGTVSESRSQQTKDGKARIEIELQERRGDINCRGPNTEAMAPSEENTVDMEVAEDFLVMNADEDKTKSTYQEDELKGPEYAREKTNQECEAAMDEINTEELSEEIKRADLTKNIQEEMMAEGTPLEEASQYSISGGTANRIHPQQTNERMNVEEAPIKSDLEETSDEINCRDANKEVTTLIEELSDKVERVGSTKDIPEKTMVECSLVEEPFKYSIGDGTANKIDTKDRNNVEEAPIKLDPKEKSDETNHADTNTEATTLIKELSEEIERAGPTEDIREETMAEGPPVEELSQYPIVDGIANEILPQETKEIKNVKEAPIKLDLQEKSDERNCRDTNNEATTLIEELSQEVERVGPTEDIREESMAEGTPVEKLSQYPIVDGTADEILPQETKEIKNVEEAPIKLDLQEKSDETNCRNTSTEATILIKKLSQEVERATPTKDIREETMAEGTPVEELFQHPIADGITNEILPRETKEIKNVKEALIKLDLQEKCDERNCRDTSNEATTLIEELSQEVERVGPIEDIQEKTMPEGTPIKELSQHPIADGTAGEILPQETKEVKNVEETPIKLDLQEKSDDTNCRDTITEATTVIEKLSQEVERATPTEDIQEKTMAEGIPVEELSQHPIADETDNEIVPQETKEIKNVEEAPIKLDLHEKIDETNCSDTSTNATTLIEEFTEEVKRSGPTEEIQEETMAEGFPTKEPSHYSITNETANDILPHETKEGKNDKETPRELDLQEKSDETNYRDTNTEATTLVEELSEEIEKARPIGDIEEGNMAKGTPLEEPSQYSIGDGIANKILLQETKKVKNVREEPVKLDLEEKSGETKCRDTNTEASTLIEELSEEVEKACTTEDIQEETMVEGTRVGELSQNPIPQETDEGKNVGEAPINEDLKETSDETNFRDTNTEATTLIEELSEEVEQADPARAIQEKTMDEGTQVEEPSQYSVPDGAANEIIPQETKEGKNGGEVPIELDLKEKNGETNCTDTNTKATTLIEEVIISNVESMKNNEAQPDPIDDDKYTLIRVHEVQGTTLELTQVKDAAAEEATHEDVDEVEKISEIPLTDLIHETIKPREVKKEGTNSSKSIVNDEESKHRPLELTFHRSDITEVLNLTEKQISENKPVTSYPAEYLQREVTEKTNEEMKDENQKNVISEKQIKDEVSKTEGKRNKNEEVRVRDDESLDLLSTREQKMKFDADVIHGTVIAAKEGLDISQKDEKVDLIKVSDIIQDVQNLEVSPCMSDKQILCEPDPNDNTEAKFSTSSKNVPPEQGGPIVTSFSAEAEDLEAGNASRAVPQCNIKDFEEEKIMNDENKNTEKEKEKSASTESAKISLADILQGSTKGTSQVVENLIEEREPTHKQEDQKFDKAGTGGVEGVKNDEEKEEKVVVEEEEQEDKDDNQKVDSGSDAPVMVEASKDMDVKVHKKSHNILSGVGSKVKHSIAKVKKVITGKSSHPKPSSPK